MHLVKTKSTKILETTMVQIMGTTKVVEAVELIASSGLKVNRIAEGSILEEGLEIRISSSLPRILIIITTTTTIKRLIVTPSHLITKEATEIRLTRIFKRLISSSNSHSSLNISRTKGIISSKMEKLINNMSTRRSNKTKKQAVIHRISTTPGIIDLQKTIIIPIRILTIAVIILIIKTI